MGRECGLCLPYVGFGLLALISSGAFPTRGVHGRVPLCPLPSIRTIRSLATNVRSGSGRRICKLNAPGRLELENPVAILRKLLTALSKGGPSGATPQRAVAGAVGETLAAFNKFFLDGKTRWRRRPFDRRHPPRLQPRTP